MIDNSASGGTKMKLTKRRLDLLQAALAEEHICFDSKDKVFGIHEGECPLEDPETPDVNIQVVDSNNQRMGFTQSFWFDFMKLDIEEMQRTADYVVGHDDTPESNPPYRCVLLGHNGQYVGTFKGEFR